jgi:RNA 3'-terminal phosphate cyclase (ATP)
MIELDGARGEGGGQILRTSLTLSMITGQPFRIRNIRANRAKPGLMRQHLVAVQSAAKVSDAIVTGAEVGARDLIFTPRPIQGGQFTITIGTAGSCTLVLQTLIPALLFAGQPSTIEISGGTHNPMAPTAQFLQRAYCPLLKRMGASIDIELARFGFYPAGGGVMRVHVDPISKLRPIDLLQPGPRHACYAEAFTAGIPASVGLRELAAAKELTGWQDADLRMRELPPEQGPGNAFLATVESEHVTEVFSSIGERRVPAHTVAERAVREMQRYLASGAAVGEHLADQLMLPLALAGGGSFTADHLSQHSITNAEVIALFLPVDVVLEAGAPNRISVVPRGS